MSTQSTNSVVAQFLAVAFALLMVASSAGLAVAAPTPADARTQSAAVGTGSLDDGTAELGGDSTVEAAARGDDRLASTGSMLGRYSTDFEYHSRSATSAGAHCPDDLDGNACITGQFMYQDGDGGFAPARQVLVQLKDDDWAANTKVTEVRTDDHGRFAIEFDADGIDSWSQNSVFLRVFADNPAAKTTTGAARRVYRAVSETKSVDGGETLDLGVITPADHDSAWKGADWMLNAQQRTAEEANGWTRRQVRIQHPELISDRPQAVGIPMFRHVALPETSEWDWGQSTVNHEYGHMVLDTLYDYKVYNWPAEAAEYLGVCHVASSETNEGFAWVEGFAEFYEGVVADSEWAGGQDLEGSGHYDTATSNGDCPGGDTGDMDGASVEGSVAGILWDVYDESDDDGLDYSLEEIFDTIDQHEVKNVHQFWDAFRTDENHEELRQIYLDHGIEKPPAPDSDDDGDDGGFFDGWLFDSISSNFADDVASMFSGTTTHESVDCEDRTERFDGTLTASGDATHELDVSVPEGCALEVRLDGPADGDFDLYATLDGRTPTTGDFDRMAATYQGSESMTIDGASIPDDTRVALLVDAYASSGDYELVVEVVEDDG